MTEATPIEPPTRRPRRGWLIAGVLIAVLALLWGAVQIVLLITRTEYADSSEFTGTRSILVASDNGDIAITADPGAEQISVRRTVELAGWGGGPGEIGAVADGRLEIADVCGAASFMRNCSVDYAITVPEGTTVDISGGSGDITVDIDTRDGNPAMVSSDSGDVTLRKA